MATLDLGKITGKSAYEIACDNGFEGSESQWLASLKGADGVVSSAEGINVVTDLSKTIPDDTSSLVNVAGAKAVKDAISPLLIGQTSEEITLTLTTGAFYQVIDNTIRTTSNSSSVCCNLYLTDGVYAVKSYCNGYRRIVIQNMDGSIAEELGGNDTYMDYYFVIKGKKRVYISGLNMTAYPTTLKKVCSLTSYLLSAVSNMAHSNCLMTPLNSSYTTASKSNTTYTINFAAATYTIYNSYGTYIQLRLTSSVSYTLNAAYTLVYDVSDSTIKVVAINNTTLALGSMILAHNDRGVITFGLLADYINAQLSNSATPTTTSKLSGKKIAVLGDSITEYSQYFWDIFVQKTGCTFYNRGTGGSTYANYTVNNATKPYGFVERVDAEENNNLIAYNNGMPNESNIDMFIVFGGTNDFALLNLTGVEFGTISGGASKTTFCGAVHYVLQKLKAKYPTKPIVLMTPMHMQGTGGATEYTISNGTFVEFVNDRGKKLSDYVEAEKAIAQMYGIPSIDMRNCGFGAILDAERARYFRDGLHPNEDGGAKMSDYIIPILENLI